MAGKEEAEGRKRKPEGRKERTAERKVPETDARREGKEKQT